ncbi:MAG: methionine--tRNA ligase, partial [Candidatus Paceibacterota bacterium]
MNDQKFYLTTTLPYVNAEPHIGFALEIVAGDVIARYQRELLGKQVIFNTGTDEHGQKIYQEAQKANQDPQTYADEYAAKFEDLKNLLNLSYTHFIRTTAKHHQEAAQEFWHRCDTRGFIYKKDYKTKYCVGCELAKTESELVDGRCPLHPNQELEIREEENYFFKFSEFQKELLELYQNNPEFVKPETKLHEIQSFVAGGLQDFSISRLKAKMPWGITVPGDDEHVMYVWFDALVNYISTLGWPDESKASEYTQFWPGVQLAGKDNLRQQSAMWQAMLMAADLPTAKQILINGFISVDGQKMSKSLGNVISPTEMVDRYGVDAARYLLINLGPFGTDMDVTWEKLDTTYTAELANGLGNLCSRVAKLCEKTGFINQTKEATSPDDYHSKMNSFQLVEALGQCQTIVAELDQKLAIEKPWELTTDQAQSILQQAVEKI